MFEKLKLRMRRDLLSRAPAFEQKTSRTAPLIAHYGYGQPVWTPQDYASLMREGFQQNPIVYRAVRMIAGAVASVPVNWFSGRSELADYGLDLLLARPNPTEMRAGFLERLAGFLLLSGNAYVEATGDGRTVRELYALRPDRVKVELGADGWPRAYLYAIHGDTVRFDMTREGVKPLLHITLFNPLDDHYGLSPVLSAARAIDQHNAASIWNKALLDNAARPSGALVYSGPQGAQLTPEQFDRLKQELHDSFEGAVNAGRPLLLEGGLDWKPLSLTPKDMDFLDAKANAAREIALAFGIPPLLLGLPGDNTYANFAEANRHFWRETIIPLALRMHAQLAAWLGPVYGDAVPLADLDRIDALAAERDALWNRIGQADFLTEDEKREAVGYGALRRKGEGAATPDQKSAASSPLSQGERHAD